MFIYQSKVNLDEKILFGSIPHLTDPEIKKMLVNGMYGNNSSTFHSSSSGAMPYGLGDHGPPFLSISATVNYFAAPV